MSFLAIGCTNVVAGQTSVGQTSVGQTSVGQTSVAKTLVGEKSRHPYYNIKGHFISKITSLKGFEGILKTLGGQSNARGHWVGQR
jgi:hypothetical protein